MARPQFTLDHQYHSSNQPASQSSSKASKSEHLFEYRQVVPVSFGLSAVSPRSPFPLDGNLVLAWRV